MTAELFKRTDGKRLVYLRRSIALDAAAREEAIDLLPELLDVAIAAEEPQAQIADALTQARDLTAWVELAPDVAEALAEVIASLEIALAASGGDYRTEKTARKIAEAVRRAAKVPGAKRVPTAYREAVEELIIAVRALRR